MERIALTLAFMSRDCAPCESLLGQSHSAEASGISVKAFFFPTATQRMFFMKLLRKEELGLFKDASKFPTSWGEAPFMNEMFHQRGSLLVNMCPQINMAAAWLQTKIN